MLKFSQWFKTPALPGTRDDSIRVEHTDLNGADSLGKRTKVLGNCGSQTHQTKSRRLVTKAQGEALKIFLIVARVLMS